MHAYDLKETFKKYVSENNIAGDYEYDAWREYAVLLAVINVIFSELSFREATFTKRVP